MLSNHLGNVLVTISDKKIRHTTDGTTIDYYNANVVTGNDYYPGGMTMPGRKYQAGSGSYRYGFNGKENDNDVKGTSNQQDYGMRIYDPRLGKFLSVDPLEGEYPELTPYQFASNNPVTFIDRDGEEAAFRMPDGTIYVQPPSDHMIVPIPQYVRENGISLINSKPPPPNSADRVTSVVLDFVPVLGEIKMGTEFIFGMDVVTGESSPRLLSLPIIKEARNAQKVVKAEEEFVKISKVQKTVTRSEKATAGVEKAIVQKAEDATLNRVKPRKATLETVKENQPRNEKGRMIDPNSKKQLNKGKIDLGHKPGEEWAKRKEMHKAKGNSRKEVIEAENNPDIYHYEDRNSNRSHKYEKKH